ASARRIGLLSRLAVRSTPLREPLPLVALRVVRATRSIFLFDTESNHEAFSLVPIAITAGVPAVMVQRELEFASAQRSGNTVTGGTFHERETQTVLGPGKGDHPTAASPGEEAGVRFVRSVRHSSHALLPLAEGVLRERRRRL